MFVHRVLFAVLAVSFASLLGCVTSGNNQVQPTKIATATSTQAAAVVRPIIETHFQTIATVEKQDIGLALTPNQVAIVMSDRVNQLADGKDVIAEADIVTDSSQGGHSFHNDHASIVTVVIYTIEGQSVDQAVSTKVFEALLDAALIQLMRPPHCAGYGCQYVEIHRVADGNDLWNPPVLLQLVDIAKLHKG